MRKLLDHLKLETDEGRLGCIEKHSVGSFHRKEHQQEDPYSEELHNIIDKNILAASKLLKKKKGIELPLQKYQFFKHRQ